LDIIELRKEKLKIESTAIDLSKIEFSQSLIKKFNDQGVDLDRLKDLINQIDVFISPTNPITESSISLISLKSFKNSLLRFILDPTNTNLEYVQNKRDSFNNNPFLGVIRSVYSQAFFKVSSFKGVSLNNSEKEPFNNNKKEILKQVEFVSNQIELTNQKLEEYKFYPEIFKLQSETDNVEKYYKDNQLDPKSIADLESRIKISQKYLGMRYQQIINDNPEFFKLDLKTIKNYSQDYPKTIEAFLTLILDVNTEELQAINSADVKKLQLAFVSLSDVIRSNSNQEFNQDFYRLKFLSKIIE
jgi:hypothetical protein